MSVAYEFIAYEVDSSGIALVTFNRPDKLNAMNHSMYREIVEAMDEVDGDDFVRAVIFTGAGRAFCSGADISGGSQAFDRGDQDTFDMELNADWGGYLSRRFSDSTKPLIAAINGPAIGIGITGMLPMDFRMASTSAKFGFVFSRRGIVPEAASSYFLPRLVGITRALEWVYSGRIFEAAEALQAGLVSSIHDPNDLLPAARAFAREITQQSSAMSIAVARRMLWQMYGTGSPEIAHELDSRGMHFLGRSTDCAEGISSFLEKRTAAFPMKVSRDLPAYFRRWQSIGPAEDFLAAERRTIP